MIVLGIDPSLETGLAIVEFQADARPRLCDATCIKPGSSVDTDERLSWVTATAADWAWLRWQDYGWQQVAIEIPAVGRMAAAPMQWRLVGRLEQAFHDPCNPVITIKPGEAKQAVGLGYREKRKPVDEVRALLDLQHEIADTKYAREACSDAVAVAVAAYGKIQESQR